MRRGGSWIIDSTNRTVRRCAPRAPRSRAGRRRSHRGASSFLCFCRRPCCITLEHLRHSSALVCESWPARWPLLRCRSAVRAQCAAAPEAGIELRTSPELAPPPRGDAAKSAADHPACARAAGPARPRRRGRGRCRIPPRHVGDPGRPAELRPGRGSRARDRQRASSAATATSTSVPSCSSRSSGSRASFAARPIASDASAPAARRIASTSSTTSAPSRSTRPIRVAGSTTGRAGVDAEGRRSRIDTETNEGVARDGVLRFLGVPILAAPSLSFPLSDTQVGLAATELRLDSRSGVQVGVPYYWNIAPNRDATITPSASARRGAGVEAEFRYLEPRISASRPRLLPYDGVAGARVRPSASFTTAPDRGTSAQLRIQRVSDDDYWKDFPRDVAVADAAPARHRRALFAAVRRLDELRPAAALAGAADRRPDTRIEAPYERLPQSARATRRPGAGLEVGFEGEFNRFATPTTTTRRRADGARAACARQHQPAVLTPGWTCCRSCRSTPRRIRSTAHADGERNATRVIPTLSVDSAWTLERDARLFGHAVRQTLEPRLLYVNTPFVQPERPAQFRCCGKDFNFESIFSENTFSGVDRVSDAHQLTAGVTTRAARSADRRRGAAPRASSSATCSATSGSPPTAASPGASPTSCVARLDLLVPHWTFRRSGPSTTPTANPSSARSVGFRYSPGPYRT